LKSDLWKLVSLFVRKSAANEWGMVACVTCGRVKHYKKMQAGHFIPGRHNAILFDLRGIHPQCYGCNIVLGGNARKYEVWMKENYGIKVIKELDRLDDDPEGKKFTEVELLGMIADFKEKLLELEHID